MELIKEYKLKEEKIGANIILKTKNERSETIGK